MELRHLRYFVAVAEEENVSRAATKLHVSQPAVSQQIHDLEEEIGFSLFARTGKSLHLTAAGRAFARETRDILARLAGAVERVRDRFASTTKINVGYVPSGTVEILPRALRAFKSWQPEIQVTLHDLSAEEMLPLLLQMKLDVALTLLPSKLPRELGMKLLERYEPCVVVGTTHPLAKAKSTSLEQMALEPIAVLARKSYPYYHQHLRKMFATVGRKPRVSSEHDSGTSLMAAVAAGHEFTLLPRSVRSMTGRRLKALSVCPALPPWSYVALWRKDMETESVKAFVRATLSGLTKGTA